MFDYLMESVVMAFTLGGFFGAAAALHFVQKPVKKEAARVEVISASERETEIGR